MSGTDEALLRSSGLFDADFYARENPRAVADGADPLTHFSRTGWKQLLRPRPDFDVWWYWTNHLDPSSEEVNPFVHYVSVGRDSGLRGLPESTRPRPAQPLGDAARRICLFAGHDPQGLLDAHVVRYLRELSRFADVYYLCDGYLPHTELAKLDGITRGAWAIPHGGYDFGSYAMLAEDLVGWDTVEEYDELLLVNDSCYLLRPLDEVFEQMCTRPVDWWGLQATKGLASTADAPSNSFTDSIPMDVVREERLAEFEHDAVYDFHVGSYFVAYRRPVVADPGFRRLLGSAGPRQSKLAVVLKYEVGTTHYLVGNGFAFDTFEPYLHPLHPLFTERQFLMIDGGFPLLKKYFLYQNHYDTPGLRDWKRRVLTAVPDAPVDLFERHLLRTSPHDQLVRSFAITRRDDGTVEVPRILNGGKFRRADAATKTSDDWWAFPVCADDHTLPANSRAILEEIRADTSITKIVLTRSHRVEPPYPGVVVLPLRSPEGQHHLMRSGQVFVKWDARRTLGEHLASDHRLFLVRDGLILGRAGRAAKAPRTVGREPVSRWHAVLSASDFDQLAVLALTYPTRYDQAWHSGIPWHDFLLRPRHELPVDLAAAEDQLRTELEGRRLLLFTPEYLRAGHGRERYRFGSQEVSWLAAWAARTGTAIGVREHPLDHDRPFARQLDGFALDLSIHRYPLLQPLLRVADAVLTDYSGVALDFTVTGRPVISYAPDLEAIADTLLYELDHVFPGPVCRTFAELGDALDGLYEARDHEHQRRYDRVRRMYLRDSDDGVSSRRVVARVKATYGGARA